MILIVGNGQMLNIKNEYYISIHNANFLKSLQEKYKKIAYCEYSVQENDKNSDLHDYPLIKNNISVIPIKATNIFVKLFSVFISFFKYDKVNLYHIFFPGTLGLMFSVLCNAFNRRYSIYLRGDIKFDSFIYRYILRNASFILTVSPDFINKLKGINKNVIRIKPMISITKDDILLNRHFPLKKEFNLLFVGRVKEDKGILEIFSLCKKLDKDNINYKFHIVGGGQLYVKARSKNNYLDISKNIIFHGLITNQTVLLNLYKKCDIFIFPSYHEGFPRVLYEAMSQQLPIVTTDVGGIPAIMKDEENCLFVKPKNSEDLYNKINILLHDVNKRKYLGQKGKSTMEKIFELHLISHEDLVLKYLKN